MIFLWVFFCSFRLPSPTQSRKKSFEFIFFVWFDSSSIKNIKQSIGEILYSFIFTKPAIKFCAELAKVRVRFVNLQLKYKC